MVSFKVLIRPIMLFMIVIFVCSCATTKTDLIINEWDVVDIEFLNNKDANTQKIIDMIKSEGYITIGSDNNYMFYTPMTTFGGKWYYTDNKKSFNTINEKGDTIVNKIVVLDKDHLEIYTEDPKAPMKLKLIPKKK
jgi:hypothetical protein